MCKQNSVAIVPNPLQREDGALMNEVEEVIPGVFSLPLKVPTTPTTPKKTPQKRGVSFSPAVDRHAWSVLQKAGGIEMELDDLTRNYADLGSTRCVQQLVTAMKEHAESEHVITRACTILAFVSLWSKNRAKAAQAGGIEAVVSVMRGHPLSEEVQRRGCNALANMCNNTKNRVKAASAGALEAVICAMNNHPASEGMQLRGCHALGIIMFDNAKNRVRAVDAGGIQAVVCAMSTHQDEEVQLRGCEALSSFSEERSNKQLLRDLGVKELVKNTMIKHAHNTEMQACGENILKRISNKLINFWNLSPPRRFSLSLFQSPPH